VAVGRVIALLAADPDGYHRPADRILVCARSPDESGIAAPSSDLTDEPDVPGVVSADGL